MALLDHHAESSTSLRRAPTGWVRDRSRSRQRKAQRQQQRQRQRMRRGRESRTRDAEPCWPPQWAVKAELYGVTRGRRRA
eukprot:1554148-Prymnesium_polylepis.2